MRLLNTNTLALGEFVDADNAPKYAILSHRWGEDEVSYDDYVQGRKQDGLGHKKILDWCTFARARRWEWVWIDTCCIDKRSSAELSEAINSMYVWYARADECVAHLSDVTAPKHWAAAHSQFRDSTWFTRGWTLQELIAPANIIFVSRQWEVLGYKIRHFDTYEADAALQKTCASLFLDPFHPNDERLPSPAEEVVLMNDVLSDVTGIPQRVLRDGESIRYLSVAQRMSWLSKRRTTRTEDMAYCMFGILGINMSLLYGEGSRALLRLQREVISSVDDDSIYAWNPPGPDGNYGMLATGFRCFDINEGYSRGPMHSHGTMYTITSRGVQVQIKGNFQSHAWRHKQKPYYVVLQLSCTKHSGESYRILLNERQCGHYLRSAEPVEGIHGDMEPQWNVIDREELIYVHSTIDEARYCMALASVDYPAVRPLLDF